MSEFKKLENYEDIHGYVFLEYLRLGREALRSHPHFSVTYDHLNSAFCRLLIVAMVSAFEAALEAWSTWGPKTRQLWETYEKHKDNGQRINALFDVFNSAGVQVDKSVLEKYLALKYLRNRIVHPKPWSEEQREIVLRQGFPAQYEDFLTGFTENHWRLIWEVFWKMRNWVYQVGMADTDSGLLRLLADAPLPIPPLEARLQLIQPTDLPRVWLFNVKVVSAEIYRHMETTLQEPKYAQEFFRRWDASMPGHQVSLLKMRICRDAAKEGFKTLTEDMKLTRQAFESWLVWWNATFETERISAEHIAESLMVLKALHSQGRYLPPIGWTLFTPAQLDELIAGAFPDAPFPPSAITHALMVGKRSYDAGAIPAAKFLTLRAPVVDIERTADYAREGIRALIAAELASWWYAYAESTQPPPLNVVEHYDAWHELLKGWATNPDN